MKHVDKRLPLLIALQMERKGLFDSGPRVLGRICMLDQRGDQCDEEKKEEKPFLDSPLFRLGAE
jgi:hypothetical protein